MQTINKLLDFEYWFNAIWEWYLSCNPIIQWVIGVAVVWIVGILILYPIGEAIYFKNNKYASDFLEYGNADMYLMWPLVLIFWIVFYGILMPVGYLFKYAIYNPIYLAYGTFYTIVQWITDILIPRKRKKKHKVQERPYIELRDYFRYYNRR